MHICGNSQVILANKFQTCLLKKCTNLPYYLILHRILLNYLVTDIIYRNQRFGWAFVYPLLYASQQSCEIWVALDF